MAQIGLGDRLELPRSTRRRPPPRCPVRCAAGGTAAGWPSAARRRPHSLSAGPLTYSTKSAMSCGVSSMLKSGIARKPAASQRSRKSTMPQPLVEYGYQCPRYGGRRSRGPIIFFQRYSGALTIAPAVTQHGDALVDQPLDHVPAQRQALEPSPLARLQERVPDDDRAAATSDACAKRPRTICTVGRQREVIPPPFAAAADLHDVRAYASRRRGSRRRRPFPAPRPRAARRTPRTACPRRDSIPHRFSPPFSMPTSPSPAGERQALALHADERTIPIDRRFQHRRPRDDRRPHAADGDGARRRRLERKVDPRPSPDLTHSLRYRAGRCHWRSPIVPGGSGRGSVTFATLFPSTNASITPARGEPHRQVDPAIRRHVARHLAQRPEVPLVPPDGQSLQAGVDRDLIPEKVVGPGPSRG